jgi:hypothetical protein
MMKLKIGNGVILTNLIVIGLAVVSYLSLISIQLHYPYNNMVTDDRTPAFGWSGQGHDYELLIDDDPGFGSANIFDVMGNTYEIQKELPFGTYWWKVRSREMESEARKFTLVSAVVLSRLKPDLIHNSGNTELLVHSSGLTGAVTLAVNQTLETGEEENVKAEQK